MANKKEKEQEVKQENLNDKIEKSITNKAIVNSLINTLNKDSDEKVAWNLLCDKDNPTDVKDWISTGSTLLNKIISNGKGWGIPVGKLTEIVGEEASGKSLLVTHILANTQKKGGIAVLLDTENALNPEFAARLGLNLKELVYLQPSCIEECFESIEKIIGLMRAKDVKKNVTIVWDSTAQTPPKAEIEGDYDPNSRIGLAAKALAKGMRKLIKTVGRDNIALVFTNQMKVKIGCCSPDTKITVRKIER